MKCIFFLLTTLVSVNVVLAADIFVSPQGVDTNSGSLNSPLRTLNRAAAISRAGDTVYVRAGSYPGNVSIYNSGTASASIRFRPYNNERVVIDATNSPTNTTAVSISASYIEFQGFEVQNAKRTGISTWAVHHVRLIGNRVYGSQRGAIWVGDDRLGRSYDNIIDGNIAYNNCLENISKTASGGWPVAVMASSSERTVVRNNIVFNNFGEGIGSHSSRGNQLLNNISYDNYSVLIYLDNSQNTLVEGNFAYSTGNQNFYRSSRPANGITQAVESTGVQLPLSGNRIINNIVVGARRGIHYAGYEVGGGLQNNIIAHNTVVNSVDVGLQIDSSVGHYNNTIAHNIFYKNPGGVLASGSATGFTVYRNTWFGGTTGAFGRADDVLADPRFISAGSFEANSYRLQSTSPSLRVGSALIDVALDYSRIVRSSPVSAGAFEEGTTEVIVPQPPVMIPTPTLGNIIVNPSFEDQLVGWENWGNASVTNQFQVTGNNGVRIGTASGGLGQSILNKVIAGRRYRLRATLRLNSSSEQVWFGVNFTSSSGQQILKNQIRLDANTVSKRYEVEFIAPAGAAKAKIFVWKDTSQSYVYGDDFELNVLD